MSEKKQEIKTIEVRGKKHTLVNPGARWYLQHLDRCKNQFGVLQQEKYIEGLLNCCVAPTLSIDDFENDLKNLHEVIQEIENFLNS